MKNRDRDNETGVSKNLVEKSEDAIQITAVWDVLRFLFNEQTEAVGQLRFCQYGHGSVAD
jgi:hypothetical protein